MIQSNQPTRASSDQSLLRQFESGEQDAATQIYLRYSRRLLHLARTNTGIDLQRRFDPEDVVQSVFRTFFRRASTGCYDVPAGGELWKLLLVLALNKVRRLATHHRAQMRATQKTVDYGETVDGMAKLPDHDTGPAQILELVIESLLDDMSPSERQIIELRIQGCTICEISARSERAKRTVERVLQSFRRRLGEIIGNDRSAS